MDRHVARLYTLAIAVVVLMLSWAVIAARPWVPTAGGSTSELTALQARETALRRQAAVVRRVTARRWAVYRTDLAGRRAQIADARRRQAAAPAVRVVNLPPLTVTRSS